MNRLLKIGQAAEVLGVSISTLRRWELNGTLLPDLKSEGGTRYYDFNRMKGKAKETIIENALTIAYARVSSHDQKKDLATQSELLENYCCTHGWNYLLIQDLGSGMNYRKKGLKKLLNLILSNEISRLVMTHKDRLLRFGAELVFALCEEQGIEIVVINKGKEASFEEELVQDVLEIITVFSARLYGSRSRKNKKLVDAAKVLLNDDK